MRKIIWALCIFVVAYVAFLMVYPEDPGYVRLGYCPTMTDVAKRVASVDKTIVLVGKSSSLEALDDLNRGEIDIALIGRLAKSSEISAKERILGKGHTLVGHDKKFIPRSGLDGLTVHTAVDADIARSLLPDSAIIFYNDTKTALREGMMDAALIDWDHFEDDYELIVVMDGVKKAEEFRIPVLYSKDINLEEMDY